MPQIILPNGSVTLVDAELIPILNGYRWHPAASAGGGFYARTNMKCLNGKSRPVMLHHVVIGFPLNKLQVDHINGDKLDNRRCNLRVVTPRQNNANRGCNKNNSTGFKGVFFDKNKRKYTVNVGQLQKKRYFGVFDDKESAAKAYDIAALKEFGEFAKLNFESSRELFKDTGYVEFICRSLTRRPMQYKKVSVGTDAPRHNPNKVHCPKGHPYDEVNTRIYRGYRYCKQCRRDSKNLYMKQRRLRERSARRTA